MGQLQFLLEHVSVQEEERIQRLILRGCAHLGFGDQVCEESGDFLLTKDGWMALPVV